MISSTERVFTAVDANEMRAEKKYTQRRWSTIPVILWGNSFQPEIALLHATEILQLVSYWPSKKNA